MDAESLIDPHLYGGDPTNTPGYKLFRNLIDAVDASGCESCTARECCPFCGCDDYDDLYERKDGEVVGCTECVKRR